MVKTINNNYSLLSRFISIIFLIFLTIAFCLFWKVEDTQKKMLDKNLSGIAHSINQNISSNFHHVEDKMQFLAIQIANKHPAMDDEQISALLKLFSAGPKISMIEWVPVGWADHNNGIKIDHTGAIKTAKDISNVTFSNDLKLNPFRLRFSSNKNSILSVAMGVKSKNGVYLGRLTTGIYLEELNKKISSNLESQDKSIYYAVLDMRDNSIIVHSSNFDINKTPETHAELSEFATITKNKNYKISRISDSPFALIIGAAPLVTNYKEYFYGILPYKFEISFLLISICGLIALFYFSILAPFLILSKTALAISNGNTDISIPDINSKEGALVAAALDKIKTTLKTEKNLVQEVTQTRNTLALTNLRLENKVADRTKELNDALAEKTSFINNLSHEIRAPLQGMSSALENLVSYWPELPEEKKFQFTKQAAHGSQYLTSLIANLLDIAKFSDGKIILDLKNINLVKLTKEVIEECKMLYIHNKQVKIIIPNDSPIYMSADENLIKQVLRNLLLNAIKFSNSKGSISINFSPTTTFIQEGFKINAVQFSINDQGIGIPDDELSNIFSPFSQGGNAKNKSTGSGLGLTICREIINAHYGKIWAENNKDGGASFNFIIPITQPIELVNNTPSSLILNNSGYNILMVDDEEVCLNSMEMLLYDTPYNLIKIKSAQFALQYLKENSQHISVIFIDLMMPDIYGINLLSAIKEDPILSSIPVILQTSSSDENEILKAFEKGIFSFITKPYQQKKLLEEINRAIQFKHSNPQENDDYLMAS